MKRVKNHPLLTSFLIGLVVFLIVCGTWRLGHFQAAELWIYDHLVVWRAGKGTEDHRIVLISEEETDIEKYDHPIRDDVLAKLLENVEKDQPRAIGIDLYRDLPEPRNGSHLAELNQVLAKYPNIVCIFLFGDETNPYQIAPPVILKSSLDRIGFNDFGDDKTIRRGLIYMPDSFQFSSLPWQLALLYLAPMGIGPGPGDDGAVALGKTTFKRFTKDDGGYVNEKAGGYQFLIDYKGPQTFTTYTVDQVLTAPPPGAFHDKVVLLGAGGASSNDFKDTPFSKLGLKVLETGVSLHAKIVNQFLRAAIDGDKPTTSWSISMEVAWIFGWCMLATVFGYYCHSSWSYGSALVGTLLALGLISWLAFLHGYWLLVATPGAVIVLASGAVKAYMAQSEARQRSMLMGLFSQHVSKDVARLIWERRDEYMDGNKPKAQRLMATVLFTDLKDYSTVSEKMEPDVLIEWVSECLGALTNHVHDNHGMMNKYMGDAIMAVFGAPFPSTTEEAIRQDAINAVRCALGMRKEMESLNAKWQERGLPQAGMRIGIYTGVVMGGLVGNADRLEYTTMGDTTNTAARLESVEKENTTPADGMARILIGESTFNLVKECFSTELMAKIKLKGQNKTTVVYRILGAI